MEDRKKISLGDFSIYALFFVLIFSVFASDLANHNFGSEEERKQRSIILDQSTSKVDKIFQKIDKPNRDIIRGKNGWLFYRPYMAALNKRAVNINILNEVTSMKEVLARRGIKLIVLPVPVKAQLHNDKLVKVNSALNLYKKYIRSMQEKGIDVVDLSKLLDFKDSYLKSDTHWSPQAVDKVAKHLSGKIEDLSDARALVLSQKNNKHVGRGNLSKSLDEMVSISKVITEQKNIFQVSLEGEVLLLGDSFANIFSDKSLGWGEGAGLCERLAYCLQQPVDKIAVNNGGESGSRNILMEELSTGYDRLKNKKYCIWEFNCSEFAKDEWTHFSLPEKIQQNFLKIDKPVEVKGRILGMSEVNRNSVYENQLASIRMQVGDQQVLFRAILRRYGSFTSVADLKAGDMIKVKLRPIADEARKIARTEFNDLDLQLQNYCFGEIETKKFKSEFWNMYAAFLLLGILGIRFIRRKA